ncbi:MAG: hypothetical protein ICV56_04085 [Nitrososphaeraceae archaeon]|nr:hypothetical protein [Nitrososphaeraceae archaeon]
MLLSAVSFNKNYYLKAFIIIFLFWSLILVTSGSLFSGYHFTDDHEIIDIYHDINFLKLNLLDEIIKQINSDLFEFHRFRPFYYIHRVIQTRLFGINWLIWSIYNGILGILSTFFIFAFGRIIKFSLLQTVIFTSITILGSQSAIWWRLGPAETLGTFLLSIVLMLITTSIKTDKGKILYEVLFVTFTLLMSLCKESFVVTIPAILFIKVWLYGETNNTSLQQSLKDNMLPIVVLSLTFLAEIILVKLFVGTEFAYAGLEINFTNLIKSIRGYGYGSTLPLMTLITIGLLSIKSRRIYSPSYKNVYCLYFLFFIMVLPQIVIYTKTGISERYILPGILGYSFLIAGLIKFFDQQLKIVGKLLALILIIAISLKLNMAFYSARDFAEEGRNTTALLRTIEANTVPNSPILIVVNPWSHYEWSVSIQRYLNYVAKRNNLYFVTYGSKNTDFYTNVFLDTEKLFSFLDPEEIKKYYEYRTIEKVKNKKNIQCIVVFPNLRNDFLKKSSDWFSLKKYKENKMINFHIYSSLRS